jgi:predicted 2-oxoglutarate/Fe(II)-dependent dioxygenase YbiX
VTNYAAELAAVLGKVNRPGDYFVSGRGEFLPPRIEVEGVGLIAFPLLPAQARQLIEAATRAPYGRGEATIYDEKVRRTWQIDGSQVKIGGKHGPEMVARIVAKVAEGLGVEGPVAAELYKLLIYEKGSFFVSHRDTEKAPGMFATLVVALPSHSEGGELIVRHGERKARLDLRAEEPSEFAYAAFYADCVHEVAEVTAGCRATLVFNLVRQGKGAALKPPGYQTETKRAASLLAGWAAERQGRPIAKAAPDFDDEDDEYDDDEEGDEDEDKPERGDEHDRADGEKLIYLLEHAYTPAELSFDKLKGADAAVARLLVEAAPLAKCDLHLALMKIWESGAAESKGGYDYRRRRYSRDDEDEDFEVVEVSDYTRTLSDWRRPDGSEASLGELPFLDAEISPPDALKNLRPEKQYFHEATGNEGASFERTYARAALVLWPRARILAVLNQAGLRATLPYLAELIEKRAKGDAVELAGHMLATWGARRRGHASDPLGPTQLGRMLSLVAKLGETSLVEVALGKLIAAEGHAEEDSAAVLESLELFALADAVGWLEKIIDAVAVETPGAGAALLAAAVEGDFARQPHRLAGAARRLVDRLPGNPATAPKNQWGHARVMTMSVDDVDSLVKAVDGIDETVAGRAARHILTWPKAYDLDEIVVPAVRRLVETGHKTGPAFEALRAAAAAHLQKRIDEPLEAPKDWRRPSTIGCKCAHCTELSKFLADPGAERWALKALQNIRLHVEHEIRSAKADVDTETLRKGSPQSLICVKNQGSYQRRVAQRERDLADREALRA